MGSLLLAAGVLLVTHLGASASGLRGRLVSAIGQGPYMGLYLVVALGAFAWLIYLYVTLPRLDYFWFPDPRLYWVPKVLMLLATTLLVGGFMVRNPTATGQEGVMDDPAKVDEAVTGVNRITRHPFQWAVVLWAASHLAANGDQVSVVFFSAFMLLSLLGTLNLDAKKRAQFGERFATFESRTSNLPFAAIVSGRNRLALGELVVPLLVGATLYAAMYYWHSWLGGVELV